MTSIKISRARLAASAGLIAMAHTHTRTHTTSFMCMQRTKMAKEVAICIQNMRMQPSLTHTPNAERQSLNESTGCLFDYLFIYLFLLGLFDDGPFWHRLFARSHREGSSSIDFVAAECVCACVCVLTLTGPIVSGVWSTFNRYGERPRQISANLLYARCHRWVPDRGNRNGRVHVTVCSRAHVFTVYSIRTFAHSYVSSRNRSTYFRDVEQIFIPNWMEEHRSFVWPDARYSAHATSSAVRNIRKRKRSKIVHF